MINIKDEEATIAFASCLARQAHAGDCIALEGPLGAGKTAFARAFIRALAGGGTDVPSPTFMLMQSYDGVLRDGEPVAIAHWDLYRITSEAALAELGLEEGLAGSITLVEWPQVAAAILPDDRLTLIFAVGDHETERLIHYRGNAAWLARVESCR